MKRTFLIITALISFLFYASAQSLDLFEIMKGEDFTGYWPEDIYWGPWSQTIYFRWNPDKDKSMHWYSYSLKTHKIHKLSDKELKKTVPASYQFSPDSQYVTFEKNGDILLLNLKNNKLDSITHTQKYEYNPQFTASGDKVIFIRSGNLFSYDLHTRTITQLTDIKPQIADTIDFTRQKQWLIDQNKQLFHNTSPDYGYFDLPGSYKNSSNVRNLQLSPDQRYITYDIVNYQYISTGVPHFVTKDGFTKLQQSRAKVGFSYMQMTKFIYDTKLDTTYKVDIASLPGIKDWPLPYKGKMKGLRRVSLSPIKWSSDGKYALMIARSTDNKDRWIFLVDLGTGKIKTIDRQTDKAWIGGPGISSWFAGGGNWGWIPGTHIAWFQSEKTGYSHLYAYNVETGKTKQLTHGKFEIYNAYPTHQYWYIVANKEEPGQRQLYQMPLSGGKMTRITHLTGNNEIYFSPDYKYIAIRYSNSNTPWEIYLKPNNPEAQEKQITHSTTKEFQSYNWRKPEIIKFKARDGATVYARLFLPGKDVRNGAAILFVHGAGYLQEAHRWWSYYYREYMFHNLLADEGFTVLDIDYRGSQGYGRDWRTGIYRHMGGKDLDDLVDGARFLVKEYNIDPKRIGIYGGSYGGFLTLMAMFKQPDVFCCGAALRSVTNWANYNHGYTSNILNLPTIDPQAYTQSSPIYFAQGLKGKLLILHGMIDDNVHFQDVAQLIQRLIELHKTGWQITPYPVERHSFKHASSWQDEYRRIHEFFLENLLEKN